TKSAMARVLIASRGFRYSETGDQPPGAVIETVTQAEGLGVELLHHRGAAPHQRHIAATGGAMSERISIAHGNARGRRGRSVVADGQYHGGVQTVGDKATTLDVERKHAIGI